MASERVRPAAIRARIGNCTGCGDCLESCPTYVISGLESESPRGRIALMQHALDRPDCGPELVVAHIDSCTGCLSCVDACPEDVRFDALLPLGRALADSLRPSDPAAHAARRLKIDTVTHPWTLKRVAAVTRAGRRLSARLPEPARTVARLYPAPYGRVSGSQIPDFTPAAGRSRGRVGLLLGCSERVMSPQIHVATVAVLAAEGFDVIAPRSPDCCGAVHLQASLREAARERALKTIAAFAAIGEVDQVLTSAGGCGAALKLYGQLLGSSQARAFSSQVQDVCQFLTAQQPRRIREPLPLCVAWHDSCQIRNAQHLSAPGRTLLEQIPQIEIVDTAEPGLCCGATGAYAVDQPELSRQLGARRALQLAETPARIVACSSADCAQQLRRSSAASGRKLPICHPVELLAASLGVAPRPPAGIGQ